MTSKGFTDEEQAAMKERAKELKAEARVCHGRQGRLLLPKRAEVQHEVRNVGLQRHGES